MRKTGSLEKAIAKKVQDRLSVKAGFVDGASYPDGTSIAQVAFWNEYGTATSPPRPFFRKAIEDNKSSWSELISRMVKRGDKNLSSILHLVGIKMSEDIRSSLLAMNVPENSDVTALLKSQFPNTPWEVSKLDVYMAIRDVQRGKVSHTHRKPLVWSGLMSKAINYEVGSDES